MNAKYIVFDGMDGSGKDTQFDLLREKLSGLPVVFTREPGGSPYAEEIRKLVRDHPLAATASPLTHFLLFWAAREDTTRKLILPSLLSGNHVLSNRGDSSTMAYQLWGEQHEELFGMFQMMRGVVFDGITERNGPDLYIIFDLFAKDARERATRDSKRTQTHFDVKPIEYYQRVRDGFFRWSRMYRVKFINADQTPEAIHRNVMQILADELEMKFAE